MGRKKRFLSIIVFSWSLDAEIEIETEFRLIAQPYLHIFFDEASSFDARLHVKTYVHFHLGLLICQFDDWYLQNSKIWI